MTTVDVLVIGAGQAGLASGCWLRRHGTDFMLIDRVPRIGDSWRRRWDSLTLFTPAAYSALPGLALPGDPGGFSKKDDVADYLEGYVRHFAPPLQVGDGVARLERNHGTFIAALDSGTRIAARAVVVASGAFQVPAVPNNGGWCRRERGAADPEQLPQSGRAAQGDCAGRWRWRHRARAAGACPPTVKSPCSGRRVGPSTHTLRYGPDGRLRRPAAGCAVGRRRRRAWRWQPDVARLCLALR